MRMAIADDSDVLRESYEFMFSMEFPEIEIFHARDGLELLDLVNKERIDLIQTDYLMPRMNGLDAARRIHESHPNIPILMVSSSSSEGLYGQDLKRSGVERFYEKGKEEKDLIKDIRKYLEI